MTPPDTRKALDALDKIYKFIGEEGCLCRFGKEPICHSDVEIIRSALTSPPAQTDARQECWRCDGDGVWMAGADKCDPVKCDPCPAPERQYNEKGWLLLDKKQTDEARKEALDAMIDARQVPEDCLWFLGRACLDNWDAIEAALQQAPDTPGWLLCVERLLMENAVTLQLGDKFETHHLLVIHEIAPKIKEAREKFVLQAAIKVALEGE